MNATKIETKFFNARLWKKRRSSNAIAAEIGSNLNSNGQREQAIDGTRFKSQQKRIANWIENMILVLPGRPEACEWLTKCECTTETEKGLCDFMRKISPVIFFSFAIDPHCVLVRFDSVRSSPVRAFRFFFSVFIVHSRFAVRFAFSLVQKFKRIYEFCAPKKLWKRIGPPVAHRVPQSTVRRQYNGIA